ncbi:MAG: histidinol-phosphate transaminase [Pelagibacteraceae bacterium]
MSFPKAKKINIQRYEGGLSKLSGIKNPIKLSSNESALGCSPIVIKSLNVIKKKIFKYPDSNSILLKKEISKKFNLNINQLIIGSGSDEIISFACQAFLEKGDEVIVPEFSFLMYRIYAQINGAKVVYAKEKNFKIDIKSILNCVSKKTKIVFLANPNNPTGTYLTINELKILRKKLPSKILLLVDDAYWEYIANKDYASGIKLFKNAKNVLVTRTFSKIYGLASLRLGWGYASKNIISSLLNYKPPFNITTAAEVAGVQALKDNNWIVKNVNHNEFWRKKIYKKLIEKNIQCNPPTTNFFLMRFDNKYNADQIFNKFAKYGIILRKMKNYKINNSLRVTVGNVKESKLFINLLDKFF